jgi:Ni/Co efflux regulator RcnB
MNRPALQPQGAGADSSSDCSGRVQARTIIIHDETGPIGLICIGHQEIDMKKMILAASAALLMVAPALAFAQDDHHHEEGPHAGGGAPASRPPSAAPARPAGPPQATPHYRGGGQPQGPTVRTGQPGVAARPPVYGQPQGQAGVYRPPFNGQGGGQPNGAYRPGEGQARPGGAPGAPGYQGGRVDGGPAYAGGARGPRPGAQAFAYGGRQFYRYRAAPYNFPRAYYGWSGHAWRRGEWLPSVFIVSSYFINDWYDFGLYQPQYGDQWIRVGADAVLIDLASGQVLDVVPGVYYY